MDRHYPLLKESALSELKGLVICSIGLTLASSMTKEAGIHSFPLMIFVTVIILVANVVMQQKEEREEAARTETITVPEQLARLVVNVMMLALGILMYIIFMAINGLKTWASDDSISSASAGFKLTTLQISTFTMYAFIRTVFNFIILIVAFSNVLAS